MGCLDFDKFDLFILYLNAHQSKIRIPFFITFKRIGTSFEYIYCILLYSKTGFDVKSKKISK